MRVASRRRRTCRSPALFSKRTSKRARRRSLLAWSSPPVAVGTVTAGRSTRTATARRGAARRSCGSRSRMRPQRSATRASRAISGCRKLWPPADRSVPSSRRQDPRSSPCDLLVPQPKVEQRVDVRVRLAPPPESRADRVHRRVLPAERVLLRDAVGNFDGRQRPERRPECESRCGIGIVAVRLQQRRH